jgi:pimeloyl-ACP methyl ester carboxylesterase
MKPSRSEFITVRGLRTHVRHWGREGAPIIFMVHGWMDVGASFQFVADALQGDWHVIAPDWRGFGLTERQHGDTYYFPDYLGDLDAMLEHSMGGNIVGLYAGARPARIRRLINLEGFGMKASRPEQAPGHYARWLDGLRATVPLRSYPSLAAVASRLQKTNPRLSNERAAFLAPHWSAANDAGDFEILGDPAHKKAGPILYRVEEVMACWSAITAPVLWVEAEDTNMWEWMGPKEQARAEVDRRLAHLKDVRAEMMPDAGHMLHHDQPEALARLIESFL